MQQNRKKSAEKPKKEVKAQRSRSKSLPKSLPKNSQTQAIPASPSKKSQDSKIPTRFKISKVERAENVNEQKKNLISNSKSPIKKEKSTEKVKKPKIESQNVNAGQTQQILTKSESKFPRSKSPDSRL